MTEFHNASDFADVTSLISEETKSWMVRFRNHYDEMPSDERTHVLNQIAKGIRKDLRPNDGE